MQTLPTLSLVVPAFNEEDAIDTFFSTIEPILEKTEPSYEIIVVNDGSRDSTLLKLVQHRQRNTRIKIIDLSRNFGKELALTAGLELSSGAAVIPIDIDLQDPPELIPAMLKEWCEGFDVVLAARRDRNTDSFAKRLTATWFYRVFDILSDTQMPANVGDYRLMDRMVVDALKKLPERSRFMKGLFAWLGFKQTTLYFTRAERTAGTTKWNGWKLWNLALDGIFSFSITPLRVWTYIGLALSFLAMLYLIFIVVFALLGGIPLPGYPSLLAVILFFNGIIMIGMGILGEYIGRIFLEAKQRPLYLIRSTEGFDSDIGAK